MKNQPETCTSNISKCAATTCALLAFAFSGPARSDTVIEKFYELNSTQTILTKISEYSAGIDDVIVAEDPHDAAVAFTRRFCTRFVVNYGNFGSYNTETDLYYFLVEGIAPAYSWGFHSTLNPRVYVNGNTANSKFYLFAYATPTGTTEKQEFFGKYDIDWKRQAGKWCISKVNLSFDE